MNGNDEKQQAIERRALEQAPVVQPDGKIGGYAAIFGKPSEDLGGFIEVIEPGFFDPVLDDDVRALWNHDPNHVLGRTASGTLQIGVDETGLRYEVAPPDAQWARDAVESVRRGDVSQSSFGFLVDVDAWEYNTSGLVLRRLIKCKRLLDVSPVTFPAYAQTTAAVRSQASALISVATSYDIDPAAQAQWARLRLEIKNHE